jgi:cation transport protein ChaC
MASAEDEAGGFWVFGYGSLMWNPGFDYLERRMARLHGFHRAFALASIRYRGTPEAPGLVLGLDWAPGAQCVGMVFRVCPSRADWVRGYLHDRELVNRSYFEVVYPVDLLGPDGTAEDRIDAICYVLDRTHPQYRGRLPLDEQAAVIAQARGPRGPNADYLHATVAHLAEIGVEDAELRDLDRRVRALAAGSPPRR